MPVLLVWTVFYVFWQRCAEMDCFVAEMVRSMAVMGKSGAARVAAMSGGY